MVVFAARQRTVLIRSHGLDQPSLEFLSDMNTLCMRMIAKAYCMDGQKTALKSAMGKE